MNYVVLEGLPAAGKTEVLELLARFYPHRVRVLPELVKTLVETKHLRLFADRAQLSDAIQEALPQRRAQIHQILDQGYVCLEESHVGVHLSYATALGDQGFIDLYKTIADSLPSPDAYIRMEIPISESLDRQHARGTRPFDVDGPTLQLMLTNLDRWHEQRQSSLCRINADCPPNRVIAELVDLLQLPYRSSPGSLEDTFDVLLLLGRPASGKSEFIEFMTHLPLEQRAQEFFLADLQVVDDFPMLWDLFLQDDLWERVGHQRLFSVRCGQNYAVANDIVWGYLIERINQTTISLLESPLASRRRPTLLIEFSRGGSSGYCDALNRLSPALLAHAAALYISVSFDESWRRNLARYDEKRRDGILTHSVPREEMERSYGVDDWSQLTNASPMGTIRIGEVLLPYVTMNNEPESKSLRVLSERYHSALASLHMLWRNNYETGSPSEKTRKKFP